MADWPASPGALDLVLDLGKTTSKLLVLNRRGEVLAHAEQPSGVDRSSPWPALDTASVVAWLTDTLADLGPLRQHLSRVLPTAHGAAFAAVDPAAEPAWGPLSAGGGRSDGLSWPVPDYEFEGFNERAPDWAQQIGDFAETQSPDLPRGLNAATQFDWLERHAPSTFARGQLVPYAQYWAWWLCGVAASEVSSLGCHTHLWNPAAGRSSALSLRRGWAARLAHMRRAWEVLGTVRPALAQRLGLPPTLRVHTGVHDSNACLARYLRSHPRLTLVTTGTWIVVMAPGAPERELDAGLDLLSNVSVRQEPVPTGRFMGGRELQHLCAGAAPELANAQDLQHLLQRGLMVLPGFETQGGPFRHRQGQLLGPEGPVALSSLTPSERATLAALYAAQVTAWLIDRLGGLGPTLVEGPFSRNPVYTGVLAKLLPGGSLQVSVDPLDGTVRGAWMLSHWTEPELALAAAPATQPAVPLGGSALVALHARWRAQADALERLSALDLGVPG